MRDKFIRFSCRCFASLLLVAVAVGCSKSDSGAGLNEVGRISEVVMPVERGVSTRTAVLDDGLTTTWVVGDRVSLWADGVDDGSSNLVGEPFTLKYYGSDFSTANFATTIESMTEGEYSYCGFYPAQSAISGKVVSYEIPAVQSGKYDGTLDFRVANPKVGSELKGSVIGGVDALQFRSVMHALKITIPEGCSALGVPVKKLILTFPKAVVGSAKFDMAAVESSSCGVLEGSGSNVVTIDLGEERMTAGDGKYVWAFINPTAEVTGSIEVVAIGDNDKMTESYFVSLDGLMNGAFAAGKISIVNTRIEAELPVTTIKFSTTHAKLGEKIDYITVTAPEGAIFDKAESNKIVVYNDGSDNFEMSYITKFYHDKFNGKTLSVVYDSKHARVGAWSYSLAGLTANAEKRFTADMPYILSENFNSITSGKTSDGGNPGVGKADISAGDKGNVDLSSYGLSTAGWTAGRVSTGTNSGSDRAIRICCRYESGASVGKTYYTRIDSPKFAYIKDGAKPNVKVKYKYKGGRYAKYNDWGWKNSGEGYTIYNVGSTTTAGVINGSVDITSKYYASYQNIDGTNGTDNNTSSQNFQNINKSGEFIIKGATKDTRASWRVGTTYNRNDFLGANGNFWLYLDNITASIVSE